MKAAHAALRAGTRDAHAAVDAVFAGFDLGARASYAAFLSAHAAVVPPLERALDAAGAAGLIGDWPIRQRASALAADMADLRLPPVAAHPVPTFATPAQVAGGLYVLEGSRMGGKLLARRTAPGLPTRYLDADQPSGNWVKLLAAIDALLYDADRTAAAVGSALRVFATFEAAGTAWRSEA